MADKIKVYVSTSGRDAVISAALGVDASALETGPSGKPYLIGGCEFNISHSGDITVCAVSEKPVGVDVELVKPRNISRFLRVLHPVEQRALNELSGEERLLAFYRIWTVKEAVCKLSGAGISRARLAAVNAYSPGVFVESRVIGEYVISLCAQDRAQVEFCNI